MRSVLKSISTIFSTFIVFGMSARTVDFTLWRGERLSAILHDYATLGDPPDGITVRIGSAKAVRYLDKPFGTHYGMFADRVVWGDESEGPRIVSIDVAPEVKPGTYACGDLRVKVIDRVLPPPSEWRYYLDLWQHPWAVARWYAVKPFSREHYAVMRPLWEMLADAGGKTLTVTLLEQPWNHQCYDAYHSMIRRVKCADGSWKFYYDIFDEYVEFGRLCGLGRDIACYTMCPWDYVVRWENETGEAREAKAIPGSSEFKEFWGDFLVDFAAHLKAKGWFEHTYIAMDERSPEDLRNIATFVQEKAPGMKISLAGNTLPSKFKGIMIDNCCFSIRFLTDELLNEAAARRKDGKITTYYVCCHPEYPNTFATSDLAESFYLGALPAVIGLDGFLRWAWNSWPKNPMLDSSYTGLAATGWKAADTYLVYPDGSPSLRFLELRNGIVAAEKLRIMKERGEISADELAKLKSGFDRDRAMKNEIDFEELHRNIQSFVNRVGKWSRCEGF